MNVRPITPLSEAREFNAHEIFFSTTDAKGVILTGNDVFARVSGFSKQELYGQPHNIIRHPDMPRAAYFLLWANLLQGRPFAGYVKNMAKDGRFYWVFVVAVPATNHRFLSVRFKPSTPLREKVEGLYKAMLAAENQVLAAGGREKEAVDASLKVAVAAITGLGFASYDDFSQLALNQEMKAHVTRKKSTGVAAYDRVDALFHQLDGFVELNHSLQQKAANVLAIADGFRLHSFNVNITADHCGEMGKGLGIVAGFLGDCSRQMSQCIDTLHRHIDEVMKVTEDINTSISMAHLQMEMIQVYQAEMHNQEGANEDAELRVLEECFTTSTETNLKGIESLRTILPQLCECRDSITKIALTIEMTQVLGNTETARIPESSALVSMFAEFRTKMVATRAQLDELSKVIDRVTEITSLAVAE
jgi:PAS domain S-box-containing protein